MSFYKDVLMVMKWKDKKDICFMIITHKGMMVLATTVGQDFTKNKVFIHSGFLLYKQNKAYKTLLMYQPHLTKPVRSPWNVKNKHPRCDHNLFCQLIGLYVVSYLISKH